MRNKACGMIGSLLVAGVLSASAKADDGLLGIANPLNLYIGGAVGRSTIAQLQDDQIGLEFRRVDGNPFGWNAVIGVRPIPFLGAEAEYLDFGSIRLHAGPPQQILQASGPPLIQQFLGGEANDRAAAAFAVGYLPLPLPFIEPFAKLGLGWVRTQDSYTGYYGNVYTSSGVVGQASGSNSDGRTGVAYGGGVQFRLEHLAVRAQYERISLSRQFGQWNSPSLLSIGANWTF